ncbi:heterokaryon incompatibility protein-domain-containing protein [Nemania sp. FL0031]|nr:heterokaryon incompatibility protein-domain-containing protein [Nemania sp. FL0031]
MRLINVKAFIESQIVELHEFFGDDIPHYVILSHTWGKEEVTFRDLQHPAHKEKAGYAKIEQMCYLAIQEQLNWIWIDTCCIDKSSSAELSEAINSMFTWYERAKTCYIYLEDVPSSVPKEDMEETFRKARWLTRGWTLQEFIAPRRLVLLNSDWGAMTMDDFEFVGLPPGMGLPFESRVLHCFTGIDRSTRGEAGVARILSWAARRQTTRREDMAYCLLGLLGVNMPLLYGEGDNAFPRLLEEVIKKSNSHGILAAWYNLPYDQLYRDLGPRHSTSYIFPSSPQPYRGCIGELIDALVPGRSHSPHFSLTNAGLSIELPIIMIDPEQKGPLYCSWKRPVNIPILLCSSPRV